MRAERVDDLLGGGVGRDRVSEVANVVASAIQDRCHVGVAGFGGLVADDYRLAPATNHAPHPAGGSAAGRLYCAA